MASFIEGIDCFQCLICREKTDHFPKSSEDLTIVERQLFVIYLVNKLLDIPSEICCNYLTNFGNPEQWLSLCTNCSSLVDDGRQLFMQIRSLEQRHKEISQEVRMRMKVKPEPGDEQNEQIILGQATNEIRHYLDALDNFDEDFSFVFNNNDVVKNEVETVAESPREISQANTTRNRTKRCKNAKTTKNVRIKKVVSENDNIEQANTDANSSQRPKRSTAKIKKYSTSEFEIEIEKTPSINDEDTFGVFVSDAMMNEKDDSDICINDEDFQAHESSIDSEETDEKFTIESKRRNKSQRKSSDPRAKKSSLPKIVREKTRKSRKKIISEKKNEPILTFAEILKKREEGLAQIPPFTPGLTKTELSQRRKLRTQLTNLLHLSRVHKVTEFPCQDCDLMYFTFAEWNDHYNIAGCPKSQNVLNSAAPVILQGLKCNHCGKHCGQASVLEDHMRQHSDNAILKCRGCSVKFPKGTAYHKHYYDMLEKEPSSLCVTQALRCEMGCPRVVRTSKESIDFHHTIMHTQRPGNCYKCLVCEATVSSKKALRKHMESSHITERKFPCPTEGCKSTFKTLESVTVHVKQVHVPKESGGPQFTCHICGASFLIKKRLQRHLKLHNPNNPHICEICGKGFKLKNYLTIHAYSHNPDLKYKIKMYSDNAKKAKQRRMREQGQFDTNEANTNSNASNSSSEITSKN